MGSSFFQRVVKRTRMSSKEFTVVLAFLLHGLCCAATEKICPVVFFQEGPQNVKGNLALDVDEVWPTNGWITELTFDKNVKHLQARNGQRETCRKHVCRFENEN